MAFFAETIAPTTKSHLRTLVEIANKKQVGKNMIATCNETYLQSHSHCFFGASPFDRPRSHLQQQTTMIMTGDRSSPGGGENAGPSCLMIQWRYCPTPRGRSSNDTIHTDPYACLRDTEPPTRQYNFVCSYQSMGPAHVCR